MNANMKRLLIFALVPITVWGIGSTFTKQKIDRIGVNTESQITMEDTTRFSSGTASTVPYLDANKDFVSSSVTPTELGYLSGVTGAIQTQLGTKTDTGTTDEITLTGTAIGLADDAIFPGTGAVTLPVGTTAQQPGAPSAGMIRYNSDDASFEGYTTEWGALGGGGAGGSRLNLLDDPSFEKGVANGSCTGCTASQDTTDYLATPNNEASLKMVFSAASGNYTWTESTSAQYSNVAGVVSAWIKTSASDCHFDELVDGTQSQTVAIGSSDEWKQYIINGTTGTTSYGWRVRCDTSITDDVFVDETFAGAAEPDTFDIGTASLWGSVKWDATTNCSWVRASTTLGAFGADADCDDNARTIKGTYNSTNGDAGNSDGQLPQIKFSYIPAGVLKCESKAMHYSTVGAAWSYWAFNDGSNTTSPSTFGDGSASLDGSAPVIVGEFHYSTPQTSETTIQLYSAGDTAAGTQIISSSTNRELEISCYHYPAPQKVVAAKCDGLECENEFSAKVSDAGIVTDENVDWISGNCSTDAGTAQFDCTLTESTANLNCTITGYEASGANVTLATQLTNAGTGVVRYRTVNSTSSAAGLRNSVLNCQRAGSDAKQFDTRFIPVVDQDNVLVQGVGNGGTSITDSVTNIDFTETVDTKNAFNGTQFTAPYTGTYLVVGSVTSTASHNGRIQAYVDGSLVKNCSTPDLSTNVYQFNCIMELTANEVLSFRVNAGITLSNNTALHHISIKRLYGDLKAFIGNLTPKEFVQTPGSTKPVMYSAHIAAAGTVSREFSNWINGNCTNANPRVCTYETGVFSSTPNCILTTTAGDSDVSIRSESSSSISFWTGLSGTSSVQHDVNITCHGVQ